MNEPYYRPALSRGRPDFRNPFSSSATQNDSMFWLAVAADRDGRSYPPDIRIRSNLFVLVYLTCISEARRVKCDARFLRHFAKNGGRWFYMRRLIAEMEIALTDDICGQDRPELSVPCHVIASRFLSDLNQFPTNTNRDINCRPPYIQLAPGRHYDGFRQQRGWAWQPNCIFLTSSLLTMKLNNGIYRTPTSSTYNHRRKNVQVVILKRCRPMYVYVCILRARVQPTLDPHAEAFL